MATLFVDSCSLTQTPSQLYVASNGSYVSAKGRFGGPGLLPSGGSFCSTPIFTGNPATLFFAFAFSPSNPSASQRLLWFWDATTGGAQIQMFINNGALTIARGGDSGSSLGTGIGTATADPFLLNVINHLEIKVVVHPSAGSIEIRMNGNSTPIFTFSGNTRGTANSWANQILLGPAGNFSDIHIFDTSGTGPVDFLGNKRIYTSAASADGSLGANQGTPVPSQSAGSHFQNVDEFPPNDDTDYVGLDAAQVETFKFAAIPSTATGIVQVVLVPRWRVDDALAHTARVNMKSSGSTTNGPTKNPAAAYATALDGCFPVNPSGSVAWTASAVNAAEGQVEVIT
jgi:hypothetical protein